MLALIVGLLLAVGDGPADRQIRSDFDEVTARATAILAVVDNLDRRLRADGLILHSDILAGRVRVEIALDQTEKAISEKRWRDARAAVRQASACVNRLERAVTGP